MKDIDRVLGFAELVDFVGHRLVAIGGEADPDSGAPPKRPASADLAEIRAQDAACFVGPCLSRLADDLAARAEGRPVPGDQFLEPGGRLVLFYLGAAQATRWGRAVRRDGGESLVAWLVSLANEAAGQRRSRGVGGGEPMPPPRS